MNSQNLSNEFAGTKLSREDVPESIFEPMNIPEGVSDDARKLFETSFYIARGSRLKEWQGDLAYLDQKIQENPDSAALHVLLAATLQGAGELDGASEEYKIAADMAGNPFERAYLLEKTAECGGLAGNQKIMVQNAALAMVAYLGPK